MRLEIFGHEIIVQKIPKMIPINTNNIQLATKGDLKEVEKKLERRIREEVMGA